MAPPKVYAAEIRRLIDAGFGDRIMFGTDNLPPEPIIERLAAMSWMTRKQRRAILYDNAARFLRLTAKQKEHERRQ
jgi:predicted TIM-barrel fold metal-dependent hydrolase